MEEQAPSLPPPPPTQPLPVAARPRRRFRIWLLLGLAVCFCCCGGLFAWIPITLRSQRHVVELRGQIQPGMPIADVMTRIDAMPKGWSRRRRFPATTG